MTLPDSDVFFDYAVALENRTPELRLQKPGGGHASGQQYKQASHDQTDATMSGRLESCERLFIEATKRRDRARAQRSCGVIDRAVGPIDDLGFSFIDGLRNPCCPSCFGEAGQKRGKRF